MKILKKTILGLSLIIFSGFALAIDPSYNFSPTSGTQLKLQCNYIGNIVLLAGGLNYNAFEATIYYDSANALLSHVSINSPFTQNQGYSFSGNMYRTYGALPGGQKSFSDVNAVNYNFRTLNNVNLSTISFTNRLGTSIVFGPSTTDDGATLNGFDVNGADILTGVYDATYNFVPLPCVPDATNPSFPSTTPLLNDRYVPSNQIISFVVYDWAGAGSVSGPSPLAINNRSHYWYSGSSLSLPNYVIAPSSVDNQEGVNSGTILATVSCPNCSSPWSYIISGNSLNITDWNGDASHNQWTWNSKRRGYNVSFDAPAPYEIERQINVSLQAVDNPNESSQIHTGTYGFYFNAPRNPIVNRLLPSSSSFVPPSKTNVIRFFVSDDWAGINTGTMKITIPRVMSGLEQLLTGYTYSGSELNFILSGGSVGLGNSGKYVVDFYSKWDFPGNETIFITGIVYDLVGNASTFTTSFTTRPDCEYFGCSALLDIDILDGAYSGMYQFTGNILIVTGTNIDSPYPYITGSNSDILVCGFDWTGAVLTGNIEIYDSNNSVINGNVYSNKQIYVTGLNFTVVDGVIIVQ